MRAGLGSLGGQSPVGVPHAPPRPVPAQPRHLPGELWGITTFYNPAGYTNKMTHLRRFAHGVRAQGLRLMVVELAFGDAPFEVPAGLSDRLVRRRAESVLWQKERLLNIGLRDLPTACDKVCWLDADLIFENDDWASETSRLLDSYVVVQPFESACWLPKGATAAPPASAPRPGQSRRPVAARHGGDDGRRRGPTSDPG